MATHKTTVDFSEEAWTTLVEIAGMLNVEKNEALRKSLGLMKFCLQKKLKGAKIIIESGRKREEITFL